MKLQFIIGFSALAACSFGQALPATLTESFDDTVDGSSTSNVSALLARGWVINNASSPGGTTSWFGSNAYIAPDQSPTTNKVNPGSNTSFIAANYNSTGSTGTINDLLETPEMALHNGEKISFETISDGYAPDAMQVLVSTNGASTAVSDFSTTVLSINSALTSSGYGTTWTDYTVTVTGLPTNFSGRIAFDYAVTNGGLLGANSSFIGLDNVKVVPEPAPLLALGLGAFGLVRRKRNR
jgi:hypothetical protein